MKVVIEFEEGQHHLRWMREADGPRQYEATADWAAQAVDVPEYVVEAYRIAHTQLSAIQNLLAHYDRLAGS